ncbi:signal transduction histidine kinase/CheY-like chemotaxis protein [Ochrobactrum daejeonense]|uniref:histidine kinase n=1 Tax=Brucella daejeonensis TaxID=659015 RepID=A0A7W9B115_9HYPH|nr:hybrid sensor histidine kinase/response regulator [Brucella daejeonensis]MBB5704252.1 signal transduction histidine kinase/CheY-like chemotaxis protein [Brucella daejeonensis]
MDKVVVTLADSVASLYSRISQLLLGKDGQDYDVERGQALTRVIIVPMVAIYAIWLLGSSTQYPAWVFRSFVIYSSIAVPLSVLLLRHVIRRPGYNLARRAFAMANDYTMMAFALVAGGAEMLPITAFVLWVTAGNGIRYGQPYLAAATGCALVTLSVAYLTNSYWQANPYMALSFLLAALLVPAYIFMLLNRLQIARDEAMEANDAKSRFLAQASHDLRQPIHAISLFTACLRDAGLDHEQRTMVENIDRSLNSVSGLFRSLLDISTLDSGRVQPVLRPVQIGKLLADVARQNSQVAGWANSILHVVHSSCYVEADAVLLTTMVQNIVSNALKYAPGSAVLIGCRRQHGQLRIEIHDRGDGITAEHLPHVFDEFYQVRERGDRNAEGVGLGLAIVRRLGRLMDFDVAVMSTKGKGTRVIISGLRIVPAPAAATMAAAPLPMAPDGLRVLLVEDDRDVLSATTLLLEKWGCIVQAEPSPPREPANWDILITDFDLGGKRTGADCIATVRKLAQRQVPAIVMTGHDEGRVRAELVDERIPVLAKPVRPAEMRAVLTTLALRAATTLPGRKIS